MAIKKYKPTSPGSRFKVVVRQDDLAKTNITLKELTLAKKRISGRNNTGRITNYHRGGGHKRKYRIINNGYNIGLYGTYKVVRIEYDPNRSGNIALCKTENDKYFYILAPHGLKVNDVIQGRNNKERQVTKAGMLLPLREIPIGSMIYNVESNKLFEFGKAAGVSCVLLKISNNLATIRLPSKQLIKVPADNLASVGRVSNIDSNKTTIGKAGRARYICFRPRVRAVAMNPIDHPMGGKTPVSGGRGGAHKTK